MEDFEVLLDVSPEREGVDIDRTVLSNMEYHVITKPRKIVHSP